MILVFSIVLIRGFSQVSVSPDGTAPHQSAMLEVKSVNRGFLPPRLSSAQRDAIVSPAAGLLIFNTDCSTIQVFNGVNWTVMGSTALLPSPPVIYETGQHCLQYPSQFSISDVPGATGYLWSVPPDATILIGQGTTTIEVLFGSQNGTVCVSALNNCDRSAATCVDVNLLPVPPYPSIAISASANPSCSTEYVDFVSSYAITGDLIFLEWYINGVSQGIGYGDTFSYIPQNNDVVTCQLTTYESCLGYIELMSNPITMTVNPSYNPAIAISATATNICNGTPVTFTATPVNGGDNPMFQWTKNAVVISGATNSTYTYVPANGDVIHCQLTSGLPCALPDQVTSNAIDLTVQSSVSKSHVAGAVAPVSKTVTYGLISNVPGETSKCWITRNLGASSQASAVSTSTESAAGWYWQFNRKQGFKHDGTTRTPNTAWVTSINQNSAWVAANDPCTIELGSPWRIPTLTEWSNVISGGPWYNWNAPWNSVLKIHAAGYLHNSTGALTNRGSMGLYWSSTQDNNTTGRGFYMDSGMVGMDWNNKAGAFTLRCVKN